MNEKILVVDDEPEINWLFSRILGEEGYRVLSAKTGKEAIAKIKEDSPDLVFLDVRLPGIDGVETLREIRKTHRDLLAIMLTGYETVKSAVEAMRLGAYDYLTKPMDNERIKIIIKNALKTRDLKQEVTELKRGRGFILGEDIIGNSPEMNKVFDLVKRVARHDITVLLRGESGTGKELIARAIHHNSERRDKPFIPIDCATLPEALVESEVFGYEKGAFTGADRRKEGKMELAEGGTVFLDEIGNLPPHTQVKLLRVLQEREVEHLGGKKPIRVDVRIITATNIDLEKALSEGRFREDLYHRINVFPIHLPSLRKRTGDIILLAKHFLDRFNKEMSKEVRGLSPEAERSFIQYRWPGNVRELENTIRSALLLAEDTIQPEHLPSVVQAAKGKGLGIKLSGSLKEATRRATEKVEKELITQVLDGVNWNKSKASQILDIDYKTLYNKIKAYGIKRT